MKQKKILALMVLVFSAVLPILSYLEEDFLKKAQKSMDLMDYDQAIYYYEKALREDPLKREIRPRLGFCYFRTGKYDDVVRVCQDELKHYPGSLHSHILLSYVYFHQGKSEEAATAGEYFHNVLEQYFADGEQKKGREHKVKRGNRGELSEESKEIRRKRILKKHDNLGLPYFILGVHHKKNSNFEKSSRYFQEAILWKYDPKECYAQLIDIELSQNDWKQALEKARGALRMYGSQAEFHFLMGYSYYQIGDIHRAETSFAKALSVKPYLTETLKNLAKVHFVKENFGEATRLFKQILKVAPLDYNTKFLLERAVKKQKVLKPTQRPTLTKYLTERPSIKFVYSFESDIASVTKLINGAALTLLRKGQLDDAIVMTERYLEVYNLSPELNYNLAHFYNMKNDLANALKYAWIAAELQEEFKDAYDLIGNVFFKMDDFDDSIKAYRRVISIDPKDAMSHYNLGCVFSAKGDLAEAERSWLSAIRYEQNKRTRNRDQVSDDELSFSLVVVGRRVAFKSYTALGHLYRNQEMWEKSLDHFRLALELEPNRSELHYEIGKIHIRRDNIPEAIKSLEKYVYYGGVKEQEVRELLKTLKSRNLSQSE